jgi:hypothetical protein
MIYSAPLERRERASFDCPFEDEVHTIKETAVGRVNIADCNVIALGRPINGVVRGAINFLEAKEDFKPAESKITELQLYEVRE